MEQQYTPVLSEKERAALRAKRAAARKKKQRLRRRRLMIQCLPAALLVLVLVVVLAIWGGKKEDAEPQQDEIIVPVADPEPVPQEPEKPAVYSAVSTDATVPLGDTISSKYGVVIDLQTNTILAEKEAHTVIHPASMTKVLTLLVAVEHIEDLDDTFTMTFEIADYCYRNDCYVVGLKVGEVVTVRELLYGAILTSGGDAALGLAEYVAGTQEAFVELMNEKLEELGLSETAHFTNCVGLYDKDHHCTVYDMAVILKAAMDNELCRTILDARTYDTAPTADHPDGQVLSNWFLRRIEDKDTGDIDVIAGKTGFVVESGCCAASAGQDPQGNQYLCVTADTNSTWNSIYDHAALYKAYCN